MPTLTARITANSVRVSSTLRSISTYNSVGKFLEVERTQNRFKLNHTFTIHELLKLTKAKIAQTGGDTLPNLHPNEGSESSSCEDRAPDRKDVRRKEDFTSYSRCC